MAGTDPKDWRTLNRLLDEALAVPPGNRAKWIDDLPADLEELKPRLKALLSNLSEEAPLEESLNPDVDPELEREREESEASADSAARWEHRGQPESAPSLEASGLAIEADSSSYHVRNLRSRRTLTIGAAILTVVLAFAALAFWRARTAAAERKRAEEVKELLASVFRDVDPYGAAPSEIPTALDMLQQARDRIDGSRPDLHVELLNVVAESLLRCAPVSAGSSAKRESRSEPWKSLPAS